VIYHGGVVLHEDIVSHWVQGKDPAAEDGDEDDGQQLAEVDPLARSAQVVDAEKTAWVETQDELRVRWNFEWTDILIWYVYTCRRF